MQPYQVVIENALSNPELIKRPASAIKDSVVIRIDDVAEMYACDKKQGWDLLVDFPNLAPPFTSFFLQCHTPVRMLTANGWNESPENAFLSEVVFAHYTELSDGGWIGDFTYVVVDRRNKNVCDFNYAIAIRISAAGNVVKWDKDTGSFQRINDPNAVKKGISVEGAQFAFHSSFLAISLMHCKNVVKVPAPPPPVPVIKQWERRGRPFLKEYTLDIHPMKRVLATEGGMATNGIKKALHICRGHFATYTDDNPLFGKVTGTFWKPMHTRGSSEIGEIKKDYRIKP